MAVLEAIALAKFYGSVPAVREVTFRLEPGQVLGYLGPNGSGKSTTVKVLTGLLQPTRGQVLFEGQDIQSDLVSYRKRLGYVPEEANLYPSAPQRCGGGNPFFLTPPLTQISCPPPPRRPGFFLPICLPSLLSRPLFPPWRKRPPSFLFPC